ncbi:MAG: hypothetical protein QOD13_1042 [Thermoleophilaceae bacterium]|nr:hypothetical protein [Thermoleophilaceae bacterium]
MRARLAPLMAPSSIAVIGASGRLGRPGYQVLASCQRIGFAGPIHPVTPAYEEILGLPCLPSIADVPEPVDLAIVAGGAERLEGHVEEALAAGAKSVMVFGSTDDLERRARLAAMARDAGVPLLGDATLGFVNYVDRVSASWILPDQVEPGGIATISQSGTVYCESVASDPRLRFSFNAHSGKEAEVSTADLIRFALEIPTTRVIGLYLEAISDFDDFVAALELAFDAQVPIVALRPGRTERSRAQIATHAARMAGSDATYQAVFRRYSVISVGTSDEWWATLALFGQAPPAAPGGLAAMTDSGGERALLLDLAAELDVPLAQISDATRERLAAVLSPALECDNPIDFWDGEADMRAHGEACLGPVLEDDATGMALVFCDYGQREDDPNGFAASLVDVTRSLSAKSAKPVLAATYTAKQFSPQRMLDLARDGIPTLDGMRSALLAVRHAFAVRDRPERLPAASDSAELDADVVARWRERLSTGETLYEGEALSMVADGGVPATVSIEVDSEESARAAAASLDGPVALKTNEPLLHKTEARGVHLGLSGDEAVTAAYRDLHDRLGPSALVAPMAPEGVELAVGVIADPLAPVVMVAAGGTLAELLDDRRFLLAPTPPEEVARAIGELRIASLLEGHRGKPAADLDALCAAISALSVLAYELRDVIAEIDINPMIASPYGCVAVDAIVVPTTRGDR